VLSRGASVALLARRAAVLESECNLASLDRCSVRCQPAGVPERALSLPNPRPALADAAKELKDAGVVASGQRISVHTADVTDEAAAAAAVTAAATAHGGRIDVVINSAGISQPRRFEETPAAEFLDVYKLNVIGTRNVTFAALPHMAGRNPLVPLADGGRVMLVSSQAGQAGLYGYTAYSVRAALRRAPAGRASSSRRAVLLCNAAPPLPRLVLVSLANQEAPRLRCSRSSGLSVCRPLPAELQVCAAGVRAGAAAGAVQPQHPRVPVLPARHRHAAAGL
jgi:NAD(P)-dependent dehydrogenase (short-subunit alcohol dehydrogenase family)